MKYTKYTYTGHIGDSRWLPYFEGAEVGEEYDVLIRDDGFLVMSNTPYEYKTNLPFLLEVVKKGPHAEVLIFGYGIGFVLPFILPFCKLVTIIENNKTVIDFAEQQRCDKVEVIEGDIRNHSNIKIDKKFDIVFSDTDTYDIKKTDAEKWLKEDGVFMLWHHIKKI